MSDGFEDEMCRDGRCSCAHPMSSEQDDLYKIIADLVDQHHQSDDYGYPVEDCCCENDRDGTDTWAGHVGRVVGDLLIDLAGTGQLLAAIDRIARPKTPGICDESSGGTA